MNDLKESDYQQNMNSIEENLCQEKLILGALKAFQFRSFPIDGAVCWWDLHR